MSQAPKPTLLTASTSGGQSSPPSTTPGFTPLPPAKGPGAKPWIIMAALAALIGLGIWFLVKAGNHDAESPESDAPADVVVEKAQRRKGEKTEARPLKKEMKTVRVEKRDDFKDHLKTWVLLEGQVQKGTKEGDLTFKGGDQLSAYLLRGGATHLDDRYVRIVGWLVDQDTLQIEGLEDIATMEAVDLLPKKSVYTESDFEQLNALRGDSITFHGKVASVRTSTSGKTLHIVFESKDGEIYGTGYLDKVEEGITEESLKKLVGKKIRLEGKLDRKKLDQGYRVTINFKEKKDFDVID